MRAHLLSYITLFVVVFTHFCSTSVIYTTEGEFINKRGFSLSGLTKLGSLAKTSLGKLKSSSSKVSSSTKTSAPSSATKTSSSVSGLSSSLKKGWNWLKGKTSGSSSSSTKSSGKSSGKTATKASVQTATTKAAAANDIKTRAKTHDTSKTQKLAATTRTSSTHSNSPHTTGTTTELSKSKKAWKKVIRGIEIAGSGLLFLNLASPLLSGSGSDDDSTASSATDNNSAAAATASITIRVSTSLGECFIAGLTGYDTSAIASASAACIATGGTISDSANAMLQTVTANLVSQNEIGQAQEAATTNVNTNTYSGSYDDEESVSVVYVTASATAIATVSATTIAGGIISDDYTVLNSSQATPDITSQITSVTAAPVSNIDGNETETMVYVTK